jgi:tRNA(Arg) A34 adenosine deaminase TadA
MNDQDERFMRMAIRQATVARQLGDVPFGAVIARGDELIVATHNSEHLETDVTLHAETKAVSFACRALGRRDLSDCVLYSTNEPCLMCATAVFSACMPRVVYALSRDDLPHVFRPRNIRLAQIVHDTQHAPEIVSGLLREEALSLFDDINTPFRVRPGYVQLVR